MALRQAFFVLIFLEVNKWLAIIRFFDTKKMWGDIIAKRDVINDGLVHHG